MSAGTMLAWGAGPLRDQYLAVVELGEPAARAGTDSYGSIDYAVRTAAARAQARAALAAARAAIPCESCGRPSTHDREVLDGHGPDGWSWRALCGPCSWWEPTRATVAEWERRDLARAVVR